MAEKSSQSRRIQGLIERLQSGDASAREELIKASCARLEHLTRKMLKSYPRVRRWEETADVFQNSVLRLYRTLQDVTPKTVDEFFRLAALNIRRELLDLVKHYYGPQGHGAKHASLPGSSGSGDSRAQARYEKADESRDPQQLADWGEFHQQVEALPEDERRVFELLWYQGLTQAQAAQVLDVNERTIKRRWQSARLQLYDALHGELPGR